MKTKQTSRRKKWLIAGGIVLLVLAILAAAFFWYVSDYYRAEDVALEVLAQDSSISVQDNLERDLSRVFSPSYNESRHKQYHLFLQYFSTTISPALTVVFILKMPFSP